MFSLSNVGFSFQKEKTLFRFKNFRFRLTGIVSTSSCVLPVNGCGSQRFAASQTRECAAAPIPAAGEHSAHSFQVSEASQFANMHFCLPQPTWGAHHHHAPLPWPGVIWCDAFSVQMRDTSMRMKIRILNLHFPPSHAKDDRLRAATLRPAGSKPCPSSSHVSQTQIPSQSAQEGPGSAIFPSAGNLKINSRFTRTHSTPHELMRGMASRYPLGSPRSMKLQQQQQQQQQLAQAVPPPPPLDARSYSSGPQQKPQQQGVGGGQGGGVAHQGHNTEGGSSRPMPAILSMPPSIAAMSPMHRQSTLQQFDQVGK
jgi:hypothetical protein